jgi:hypothetical protein
VQVQYLAIESDERRHLDDPLYSQIARRQRIRRRDFSEEVLRLDVAADANGYRRALPPWEPNGSPVALGAWSLSRSQIVAVLPASTVSR